MSLSRTSTKISKITVPNGLNARLMRTARKRPFRRGDGLGLNLWPGTGLILGAGWVDNGDGSYTHTGAAGNTAILADIPSMWDTIYQISFDVTDVGAGIAGVSGTIPNGQEAPGPTSSVGPYSVQLRAGETKQAGALAAAEAGISITIANVAVQEVLGVTRNIILDPTITTGEPIWGFAAGAVHGVDSAILSGSTSNSRVSQGNLPMVPDVIYEIQFEVLYGAPLRLALEITDTGGSFAYKPFDFITGPGVYTTEFLMPADVGDAMRINSVGTGGTDTAVSNVSFINTGKTPFSEPSMENLIAWHDPSDDSTITYIGETAEVDTMVSTIVTPNTDLTGAGAGLTGTIYQPFGPMVLQCLEAHRRKSLSNSTTGDGWTIAVLHHPNVNTAAGRWAICPAVDQTDGATTNNNDCRINGVFYAAGAFDFALVTDQVLVVELDIGALRTTSIYYSGYSIGTSDLTYFGDMLTYSALPTEEARTQSRNYLANKWGIALAFASPDATGTFGPYNTDGTPYFITITDDQEYRIGWNLDADPDPDAFLDIETFMALPTIDSTYKANVAIHAKALGWEP